MRLLIGIAFTFLFHSVAWSQGHLSGDFMMNFSMYDDDPLIGTNTTQYKRELSSAEGWMFLNYRYEGWNFSLRYDGFYNSPLLNPQEAFTNQGIGYFNISKDIGDMNITAGHFYDQFGSGIIFRAFEDRLLGLDYAIRGLRLKYSIGKNFRVKGFIGKQKFRFETHPPVIKGLNTEYDFYLGDQIQLFAGAGFINRTLDQSTMNLVVDELETYPFEDRFIPKYNVYAYTFYTTLNYKNFGWYLEYARKSEDVIRNEAGDLLINDDGYTLYSAINYGIKGFGVSIQYRKNQTFVLRTSPYTALLVGNINYLPPITQQQSLRLPARYTPQPLAFGEEGYQVEFTISPNSHNTVTANLAYVNDGVDDRLFSAPIVAFNEILGDEDTTSPAKKLYHEVFVNYYRRWSSELKTNVGIQTQNYDRDVYQGKPGAKFVKSVTPFAEVIYKLSRRKSLRSEVQYLFTEQDHGDFLFALLEFNVAPKFSISISDMINTTPRKDSKPIDEDVIHYYTIFGAYTMRQTRFTLGYIKQVEGVVCTGGVCRVEPAFSGLRFGLTTNF